MARTTGELALLVSLPVALAQPPFCSCIGRIGARAGEVCSALVWRWLVMISQRGMFIR